MDATDFSPPFPTSPLPGRERKKKKKANRKQLQAELSTHAPKGKKYIVSCVGSAGNASTRYSKLGKNPS